jgi:murein L,D-transpeptidase YafK
MPGGDVEQRVLRLDEIGQVLPERRPEGRVDVGLFRRRSRSRPDREQADRQREPRARGAAALLALAGALLAGCATPPAEPPAPSAPTLEPILSLAEAPSCPRIAHIEVRKSERRLVARCNPGPDFVMKVALGRQPVGPKTRKGDQRTPEGSYVVSGPATRNRFHRFIPIDYPSRNDADVALESGTISAAEHTRILARRSQDRPPPQDTALGGELGLHGEGPQWQGESAGLDWTFGCVAVRDHEIDFLAQRVSVGTPVWIVP